MIDVRVPTLPESIADATVLRWHRKPGEAIAQGETLVDLETDKVVLEVPAPEDGVLSEIHAPEGETVSEQALLGRLSEAQDRKPEANPPEPTPRDRRGSERRDPWVTPAARRLIRELALDPAQITGTGEDGRIQKRDVMAFLDRRDREQAATDPETAPRDMPDPEPEPTDAPEETPAPARSIRRVPMSRLRARIAERLVEAQQTAAILTTFNEVDMDAVMGLRRRYRDSFEQTHGVRLGLLSFFVKAVVEGLRRFPILNAALDGNEILYHDFYDLGIAVSTPRGLVVPVLRDCDRLSFPDIERGIRRFSQKAKEGTLSLDELTGGTFSITNGGVFGSLLSTPILNPPQSAILGMHRMQERPVVREGQILIRPMMYLALSYDHRLIDGREAVQFLVTIKALLEDPTRLLLEI